MTPPPNIKNGKIIKMNLTLSIGLIIFGGQLLMKRGDMHIKNSLPFHHIT